MAEREKRWVGPEATAVGVARKRNGDEDLGAEDEGGMGDEKAPESLIPIKTKKT